MTVPESEMTQRKRKVQFVPETRVMDETERRKPVTFGVVQLPASARMMRGSLELANGIADRGYHPVSDADDGIVAVSFTLSQCLLSEVESAVEAREIVISDKKPVLDGEPKPRIFRGLQQVCRALESRYSLSRRVSFCGDIDRAQYRA